MTGYLPPNMEAPGPIKYDVARSMLQGSSVSGNYNQKKIYDGNFIDPIKDIISRIMDYGSKNPNLSGNKDKKIHPLASLYSGLLSYT